METTTMEKMMTKNQFQIYFLPIPKQKRPYSACVLGIRLRYWCHGAHVVKELKRAQTIQNSDTRYFGGLGPCSLHLIFSSDLVKIYLVNPYTIGKISLSSISWYLEVFMFEPFLESYQRFSRSYLIKYIGRLRYQNRKIQSKRVLGLMKYTHWLADYNKVTQLDFFVEMCSDFEIYFPPQPKNWHNRTTVMYRVAT